MLNFFSKSRSTSGDSSQRDAKAEQRAQEMAAIAQMTVPQQRALVFRIQAGRETVEAFVVAFVLALLFRAFIAEAFVIPTGSMAPSLMGAHKDVFCDQCQFEFPIGASLENRGPVTQDAVVGGICPNCRHVNSLDLKNNPDHGTFSGDRILVSKSTYALSEPQRWDVIVFKVPINPKQNYIKRLVGLPGETVSILHGDVYARPTDGTDSAPVETLIGQKSASNLGSILRKSTTIQDAMSHVVYNSDYQADALIQSNYPARLQPWRPGVTQPPTDSWQVQRSKDGLNATVEAKSQQPEWLRYYHRWPSAPQWAAAEDGNSLASVDPYSSRLITDFHAYDAYLFVDADRIYDVKPSVNPPAGGSRLGRIKKLFSQSHSGGVFRPGYDSGADLSQFRNNLRYGNSGYAGDGVHWVGDLISRCDIETASNTKSMTLEIIEAGLKYQCVFDLATGQATLGILDARGNEEQALSFDESAAGTTNLAPTASTSVTAGSRHELRFSNCDNELTLCVDGKLISFDKPTTFDASAFVSFEKTRPYYDGPGNPLDASPWGVAVQDGSATVHHVSLHRDKYYIATKQSDYGMLDYDMRGLNDFAGMTVRAEEIQQVMGEPVLWDEFPGWQSRRSVSFPLEADQYFPMGDNSPESLDARCWAGTKERFGRDRSVDEDSYRFAKASYVPRDLLVGKALAIFWPHPWRKPIPVVPNFRRMQLIR